MSREILYTLTLSINDRSEEKMLNRIERRKTAVYAGLIFHFWLLPPLAVQTLTLAPIFGVAPVASNTSFELPTLLMI